MASGDGTQSDHGKEQGDDNTAENPEAPTEDAVVFEEGHCTAVDRSTVVRVPGKHPRYASSTHQ